MATCDVQSLLTPCYACLTDAQRETVITQLLCNIADFLENGGDMPPCDVQTLLTLGKCFSALTESQKKTAQTQLLCDISQSFGSAGSFIPRTGPDVATELLAYAASTVIDFEGAGKQQINATGNLTLSTTNRGNGKFVTLRIVASPGPINISVDSDIHKIGTFTGVLPAGKIAWITFFSNGSAETDTDAVYREET